MDKVIVIFKLKEEDKGIDIEIPVNITANELIYVLNKGLNLGINMDNPAECFLRMDNPIGLLHGDTVLAEYEVRNGSIIYFDKSNLG